MNLSAFTHFLKDNTPDINRNTIECLTTGQSETGDWQKYRKGRITATSASKILNFRETNKIDNYIVKSIKEFVIMKFIQLTLP